jgi:hypothetical protein
MGGIPPAINERITAPSTMYRLRTRTWPAPGTGIGVVTTSKSASAGASTGRLANRISVVRMTGP